MGSGIIFNNGGGGGGTTINPTNNFIPVRSNATTFVDSCFTIIASNTLQSVFAGTSKGLELDSFQKLYRLGDYALSTNGTMLVVDENNETIETKNINEPKGLLFDFNNAVYKFGDFNGYNNGSSLIIDDTTQNIYTFNNGFAQGISLDFINNTYLFGIGGSSNLFIDANNQYVSINVGGSQYLLLDKLNASATFFDPFGGGGIEFNAPNKTVFLNAAGTNVISANYLLGSLQLGQGQLQLTCDYLTGIMKIGDATGVGNGNVLIIDDNVEVFTFVTESLIFSGTALQSNSAGGNSGQHLVIELNGNQYKIKLENP